MKPKVKVPFLISNILVYIKRKQLCHKPTVYFMLCVSNLYFILLGRFHGPGSGICICIIWNSVVCLGVFTNIYCCVIFPSSETKNRRIGKIASKMIGTFANSGRFIQTLNAHDFTHNAYKNTEKNPRKFPFFYSVSATTRSSQQ